MSLQVWLPLNKEGNFYNQGLADVVVINNGATYNTNGKIGGCYTFGDGKSSNQYKGISINTNFSQIGEHRSICAWVRPKGNHIHYSGAIISSGDWNAKCWGFCLNQNNTGFTGFDSGYSTYYSTNIPINSWTHLCVTVENGITKFYKNGEYLGEQSRGSGSVSSGEPNTMIGRETYAGGYFSFNGDISDVRIYSHSLSPKEVHEIAKGLVLHYPMNDEYAESTVYDCSGYCNNGTVTGSLQVVNDSPRYKKSTEVTSVNKIQYLSPIPNQSQEFTFNIWSKITDPNAAANLWTPHSNGSKGICRGIGNGSIYSYNGEGLCTSCSFYNTSNEIKYAYPGFLTYTDGDWHMYTIVGNNEIIKTYTDGIYSDMRSLSDFKSQFVNLFEHVGLEFRAYARGALRAEILRCHGKKQTDYAENH